MTNSINKELTSPILEQGQGFLFHAAGANFKITGNHIEKVDENNDLFKPLKKNKPRNTNPKIMSERFTLDT